MKLSIAAVKRMLPPGTRYIGEFIEANRLFALPDNIRTTREVVKHGGDMVSRILTGPKAGQLIYGTWAGVTADIVGGVITLTHHETGEACPYLTIEPEQPPEIVNTVSV